VGSVAGFATLKRSGKDEGKFAALGFLYDDLPRMIGTSLLVSGAILGFALAPTNQIGLRNLGISGAVTGVLLGGITALMYQYDSARYGAKYGARLELLGIGVLGSVLVGNGVLALLTRPTLTGALSAIGLTLAQSIATVLIACGLMLVVRRGK